MIPEPTPEDMAMNLQTMYAAHDKSAWRANFGVHLSLIRRTVAAESALATAREQALEEAAKAMCDWCRLNGPPTQRAGDFFHNYDPEDVRKWYRCEASPIRALAKGKP